MAERPSLEELFKKSAPPSGGGRPSLEDLFRGGSAPPAEDPDEPKFDPSWASLGKAAAAFPESLEKTASSLGSMAVGTPFRYTTPGGLGRAKDDASMVWDMVSDPGKYIKAINDKGGITGLASSIAEEAGELPGKVWSDIKKRYGTLGRAQKTFETDPVGFMLDASTVTGGVGAIAKTLQTGARVTGGAISRVAPYTTGAPRAAFDVARDVGRAGPALPGSQQLFRQGQQGAAPTRVGQMASPEYRAGEALSGWLPEGSHADPMKAMKDLATRGTIGGATTAAASAAGIPWWVTAPATVGIQSPRAMGNLAYRTGAIERGMSWGSAGPMTRRAIAAGASDALKDRETKKQLSDDQVKTLRAATRPSADSVAMQRAASILQHFGVPVATPPDPEYGGTTGDRSIASTSAQAQTPSPGEASKPAAELTGETPLALPGQSPGLSTLPTSGEPARTGVPIAEARAKLGLGPQEVGPAGEAPGAPGLSILNAIRGTGRGLAQADPIADLWEMIKGGATLPKRWRESHPEEGDFGPTIEAALLPMGGTAAGAPKGAIGAGPAGALRSAPATTRLVESASGAPLGEHAIERKLSITPVMTGPAQFAPHSRDVSTIAEGLHGRASAALKEMGIEEGKITPKNRTPETDALVARTLASEAKAAMERGGHAGNWYTEGVNEAVREAAKIFPEIATDPKAGLAFRAAKAITSQGETVVSNVRLAKQVYEYFREHGRFPTDVKASKQKSINNNFKKLNQMIDDMGIEELGAFMNKKFTVKELQAITGVKVPGGWPVDHEVYGSAILGPKIGNGFFQNLSGNFNPVTTDLWLMRTWGRMTGTLHGKPSAVPKAQERFTEALRAAKQNYIPEDIKELSKLADEIVLRHERDFRDNRALYDSGAKKKSELTYAAERLQHNLSGIKETPTSGSERVWIDNVMNQARQLLEQQGIKVTNADLQAILWYPEKELYERLGGRASEQINMTYAEAWKRAREGTLVEEAKPKKPKKIRSRASKPEVEEASAYKT